MYDEIRDELKEKQEELFSWKAQLEICLLYTSQYFKYSHFDRLAKGALRRNRKNNSRQIEERSRQMAGQIQTLQEMINTLCAVALYNACVAVALAGAGNVDLVAGCEDVCLENVADVELCRVFELELFKEMCIRDRP